MRPFPTEELVERVGSAYTVVIAAAKRAKQIKEGAPPLVAVDTRNPLTIALHEIALGLVEITEPQEPIEEPEAIVAEAASEGESGRLMPDLPLVDFSDRIEEVLEEEELLDLEEEEDLEEDLDEDLEEDLEDLEDLEEDDDLE